MTTKDSHVILEQHDLNKTNDDHKSYKSLVLINEMKVMLINDLNLSNYWNTTTYFVLDVHVGNYSDPDDFTGLAQLCQEMLILGSQKYPQYKEFDCFIHNHNGNIYIETFPDHSIYCWNIETENTIVFEEALNRFVHFFVTPLFKKSWIRETINKINTNAKDNNILQDDIIDFFQNFEKYLLKPNRKHVIQSLINELDGNDISSYTYSTDGLCEDDVLKKMSMKEIRLKLFDFFDKYYSANIMTLSVISGYSLHKIESMIVKEFCQIRNKEIKLTKNYDDPFKNQLCTKWYLLDLEILHLTLSFPLPYLTDDCMTKAVKFISYILEYKGPNSLLKTLKDKYSIRLARNITTYNYEAATCLNFFHVHIAITSEGCSKITEIITLFFQYIKTFKKMYLLSECGQLHLRKILQNMCKYKIFEEEEMYVTLLSVKMAKRLHKYPVKTILRTQNSGDFQSIVSIIQEILNDYISPQNIKIFLVVDEDSMHKSDSISECTVSGISKDLIDKWMQSYTELSELMSWPNNGPSLLYKKLPEIIEDTPFVRLWHMHEIIPEMDRVVPQSKMFFHFTSPYVSDTPLNSILNIIFAKLIKSFIKENVYFPDNSLKWKLKNTSYGILLEVFCNITLENHKLLSRTISKILNVKLYSKKFELLKHNIDKNLKSFVSSRPMEQAFHYLSCLLTEKIWTYDEILRASTYVTINEIQKFKRIFIRKMHVECLIYGDMSKEEALSIIRKLEIDIIAANNNEIPTISMEEEMIPQREIKLEESVLFEIKNEFYDISCVQVYYQLGPETMILNLKLDLLYPILSKYCSVYFQKFKQMVSRVCVKRRKVGGMQGIIIAVEGSMNPNVIQHHIQQLVSYMSHYIRDICETDYEKYKTKLIIDKYSKILNLDKAANIIWEEIVTEKYGFDRAEVEKSYVRQITKYDLIMFYEEFICDKKTILSVHVLSKHEDKLSTANISKTKKSFTEKSESSDNKLSESVISILKKHNISKAPVKKIDNIVMFKQTCNYHKQKPLISTFRTKSKLPCRKIYEIDISSEFE